MPVAKDAGEQVDGIDGMLGNEVLRPPNRGESLVTGVEALMGWMRPGLTADDDGADTLADEGVGI